MDTFKCSNCGREFANDNLACTVPYEDGSIPPMKICKWCWEEIGDAIHMDNLDWIWEKGVGSEST